MSAPTYTGYYLVMFVVKKLSCVSTFNNESKFECGCVILSANFYVDGYVLYISYISYFYVSEQVGNLQYASPATVSRAGMVYVDPKNLGYLPYWESWIRGRQPEEEREMLIELFDKYVPPTLAFIFEGLSGLQQGIPLKTIIFQTPLNMV